MTPGAKRRLLAVPDRNCGLRIEWNCVFFAMRTEDCGADFKIKIADCGCGNFSVASSPGCYTHFESGKKSNIRNFFISLEY
uniref:Uncharacterized protein n=1 Tax=Meloidogyne enterolobii TaxID=390850 RepID=A0A6V7UV86_MELEN|nr:unnamed protein product [Meloidogyne enterolobii]